jgi:transposase-like protein
MSPRKLSDADKKDILNLYRQPEETTSTLASRYGVSNSTISRILKSSLLESEYEVLIQQKRSNRTPNNVSSPIIETTELPEESDAELALPVIQITGSSVEAEADDSASTSTNQRRRRKRSSSSETSRTVNEREAIQIQLPLDITTSVQEARAEEQEEQSQTKGLEELLDEDLMDLEDEDEDLDDEDEDEDEDDWEDDALDTESQGQIRTSRTKSTANVQVLPLSEAFLPKTCYLVVDRAAELIARPLKEFGDLGRIPVEEVQEKTLPVFDNHKVARRFSNRSQRVIKVPDGRMLQKTCSHLQAKGITRLLIDGQVYSLLPTQP